MMKALMTGHFKRQEDTDDKSKTAHCAKPWPCICQWVCVKWVSAKLNKTVHLESAWPKLCQPITEDLFET